MGGKTYKIVFLAADFNLAKAKLRKEVTEYFGDHTVIRKETCTNQMFMMAEIEAEHPGCVKKGLLEGNAMPLPARFCMASKPWALMDSENGTFVEVPRDFN